MQVLQCCIVLIEHEHELQLVGDTVMQEDGDEDDACSLFASVASSGAHVVGLQEYG